MPHRRLAIAITLGLALNVTAVLRADDRGIDDLPASVERLVEQLDAAKRSERRDAERALMELGPDALDHLPAPNLLPTTSAREAVRRVRLVLERERARMSIAASRVTLDGERKLRDWLGDMTRQTGNRFDTTKLAERDLDRTATFDTGEIPFWQAVDEHLRPLGLGIDNSAPGDAVALVPAPADSPVRVSYIGGFRVTLDSLRRRPLPGSNGFDLLRATATVRAEPRLRPLFLKYAGDGVRASLEDAKLEPFDPEAKFDQPMGDGVGSLRFDLRIPAATEDVAVTLEALASLTVAAGEAVIAFPPLDKSADVARRRGGVTVRTTDVEIVEAETGNRAEIGLSIAYDTGGPAFESHRAWVFRNRAFLEHRDGRRIAYRQPAATTRQSNGAVAIRYTFEGLKGEVGDYHLVYAAPTLVIDVPLRLDWKDLVVAPRP